MTTSSPISQPVVDRVLMRRRGLLAVAAVLGSFLVMSSPSVADFGETRLDGPRADDAGVISAGEHHTCAVLSDGSLWCWGRNHVGQLGDGTTTDRVTPTRVGAASNWRSVSAGSGHTTCAVNTSFEVFCWGRNHAGQVGVASTTNPVLTPTQVNVPGGVVSVSVGEASTCVIHRFGSVRCWGTNANGELGRGAGSSTHEPDSVNVNGNFSAVAVGNRVACALEDTSLWEPPGLARVYCWGTDLFGQRGDGGGTATDDFANPTQVVNATGQTIVGLTAGFQDLCIIMGNGNLRCWGANDEAYLFSPRTGNVTSPQQPTVVPFGNSARSVSVGTNFACMLRASDGRILCGGRNSLTVVGTTGQVSLAPAEAGHLAMTTGASHVCAIRADRKVICWGYNTYGQVGNGETANSAAVAVVSFGAHPTTIAGAEPSPPPAPSSIQVEGRYQSLKVTWTAPSSPGTSSITNYQYRVSTNDGGSWSHWTNFNTIGGTGTIGSLNSGTSYLVEVRAVSADGFGDAITADQAVATLIPCDPLLDCVLGSVGPHGGIIMYDAGTQQAWGRFILAAPEGWSGTADDPRSTWYDATDNTWQWPPWPSVGRLPTKSELELMATAHDANAILRSAWPSFYIDDYWSSTEFDDDRAYAGTFLRNKSDSWVSYRPVITLNGPTPLAAPSVTATTSNLAISVSWTAPSTVGNAPISSYETRLSTNGTWGPWISRGLDTSVSFTGLSSGVSYRVEVRAINTAGPGSAGQTAVLTMTPSLLPATQNISGVEGVALTASAAFTPTNFQGSVGYAVTAGTLPGGLELDSISGVVSGTPTASSNSTVTITATGATAGSATATITFDITVPVPDVVAGVWAVDGLDGVVLEWFAPLSGEPATGYEFAVSVDGGVSFSAFGAVPAVVSTSDGSLTRFTTTISVGLVRGVDTVFQVRTVNAGGFGPAFPDPAGVGWAVWGPRATAKLSQVCDPMNNCEVGDVGPGGGIIVYDHGFNASWGRYLEAAPAFWGGASGDPLAVFGCAGTTVSDAAGVARQALGEGRFNTAAILAACSSAGIAARLVDAYTVTVNGVTFDDWHLPSASELQRMYGYRQFLGGWKYAVISNDDRLYASSSDSNDTFFMGIGGSKSKSFSAFVRPVRYVAGPEIPSAPRVIATAGDARVDFAWAAPVSDGGNAVSGYEFRMSDDGGATWGVWTSLGLTTTHSATALVNGSGYVFEFRAVNRGGSGAVSSTGTMSVGTPFVSGVAGQLLTVSTLFAGVFVNGDATFAVTGGTLPGGLELDSISGVVSGVPTASSNSTVTISATIGIATATTSITFNITVPVPGPPALPTDDSVIDTEAAPQPDAGDTPQQGDASGSPPGGPSSQLVTAERQQQLTAPVGQARMLVGGVLVEVSLVQVSSELRTVPPSLRTAAQVTELQSLAADMLAQVQALLRDGVRVSIDVRNTEFGAVIVGLVTDPVTGASIDVPVEHVVLVRGGGLLLMVSGSEDSEPAQVGLDGVLEVALGGFVSVLAYGLMPGSNGEVVVMSSPRLIHSFVVADDGGVQAHAQLPTDLGVGHHTVVVSVGDEAASLGFRMISSQVGSTLHDPAAATLPVTGTSRPDHVTLAMLLVVIGLALAVLPRRTSLVQPSAAQASTRRR